MKSDIEDGTYNGFSKLDLEKKFIYDPVGGSFFSRKTGNPITSTREGRLVLVVRDNDRIVSLSAAKVALMLVDERVLHTDETIRFVDGNPLNVSYKNIAIVPKSKTVKTREVDAPKAIATEKEGVYRMEPIGFFVVRRGSTQAVYRPYSYKEAVEVREEWEKDKTIHRWDSTYPKFFYDSL